MLPADFESSATIVPCHRFYNEISTARKQYEITTHAIFIHHNSGNVWLRRSVYQWIEKIKSSRTSVKCEEREGRPATSNTDEKMEKLKVLIMNKRRWSVNLH